MSTQTQTKVSKKIQNLIEKNNAVYKAASRKEKRELILKDVLSMLRIKNNPIDISTGAYLSKYSDDVVNQETLLSNQVECRVCAKGALLCSRIRIGNKYSFTEDVMEEDTVNSLRDAFTENELDMIESIFERNHYLDDDSLIDLKVQKFLQKYKIEDIDDFARIFYSSNSKERLKEICTNILKADGDVYKGLFVNVVEKAKKK